MGIIICEKHGRTGIVTGVLKEICQKMLNDELLNQDELTTILIDYYDGKKLLFNEKYLITADFKKKLKLKDHYKISTDEEEEIFIKPMASEMGAICGKCYEEYLLRHDIKIAKRHRLG